MTDSSISPDSAPTPVSSDAKPATPDKYAQLKKVFYGLVGLILTALSVLKFVTRNDLPGCDYSNTRETLATIFKGKNVEYKKINEGTTLSNSDDLITCKSSVAMTDGTLLIDYTISRLPDSKFQVEITSARAQ